MTYAREQVIAGLRAAADWLEAHPDVPTPVHGHEITYHPRGTDAQERAEVDRIAAILGTDPEESDDGAHYVVTRSFSGGVEYRAVAITEQSMAALTALMSYRDAVLPGGAA